MLARRIEREAFDVKRRAWKAQGRMVCRHGVFFDCPQVPYCPCLSTEEHEAAWNVARFMPCLDEALKVLVATPFVPGAVTRLGILQAELRRRAW